MRLGKRILKIVAGASLALVALGCNRLPEGILDKDEMVDLLVDIHKGESVVEMQRGVYRNDSLKKRVKQSVLLHHGVTQAQLDTSFAYYGYHIEDYIEIYDKVIETLEIEVKNVKGYRGQAPVFAEGDSVDVWQLPKLYKLSYADDARNIIFDIPKDSTWQKGDNYTLQLKILNSRQPQPSAKATLYAVYDTVKVEFRPSTTVTNGHVKVRLVTDSMLLPDLIYGNITYDLSPGENIYLDSISLVRTRNRKEHYYERNSQRTFRLTN